jgi:alpha-glucuronidase
MGVQRVSAMMEIWDSLESSIDARRFQEVKARLTASEADAARWRDESVNYWLVQNRLEMPVDTAPLSAKMVVNGEEYGGFNLSNTINPGTQMPCQTRATYRNYTINVPYNTTDFNISDVVPYDDGAEYEILKQASDISDTAQVVVRKVDYLGEIKQVYNFQFAYDTTLADITIDGASVVGFSPTKTAYSAFVSEKPIVTAVAGDPAATVTITQPTADPGAVSTSRATIVVSNNGAPTTTYTVDIGKKYDGNDEFNGAGLDSKWGFTREDAANWSLTKNPGAMTLTSQIGTITGNTNTAKNILLQDAPGGDWVIETKINLSRPEDVTNEEAGIIAYTDDGNYVSLGWRRVNPPTSFPENFNNLAFVREQNGTATSVLHSGIDIQRAAGANRDQIWLRIAKKGSEYMGYYSLDGVAFKTAKYYTSTGTTRPAPLTLNNPAAKVGVYTFSNSNNASANGSLDVKYDYFNVTSAGEFVDFYAKQDDGKIVVKRDSSTVLGGVYYLGVYDDDGKLAFVNKALVNVVGDNVQDTEIAVDFSEYPIDEYTYKVFAWDADYKPFEMPLVFY